MNEREALKLAQKAMGLIGADLVCEAAHHEKKDRHQIGEPCPIQARWHQAFAAIKEALAQPEQEPVACVQDLDEVKRKHLVYEKGMDWKDPLYITPPQRTWVGLTDEEIMDMYNEPRSDAEMITFGREVEAALKEKNT